MVQLGFDQTPHCCRHTCISLLAEAKVSPTYQKMIVGHKGAMSLTEKVYTHIDINLLNDIIGEYEYSGILDTGKIKEKIDKPLIEKVNIKNK